MFKIKLDAVEISKTQIALHKLFISPQTLIVKVRGRHSYLKKSTFRNKLLKYCQAHKCDGNIAKNIYGPYIFF